VGALLIPVFLFYFLRDFDRMKAAVARLLPPRDRQQIRARFTEIDTVCAAFVRGQATVAAILGIVYAVGLTLAGVKLGLLIGLLAGVASLVPFAGPAVGLALSGVAVVVDWHEGSLWIAAFAALTFVVGQILEGYVITPRVVGEKVGLSPVAVMLAVLAFGELLGFAGLLLAVPVAAVGKVVGGVLVRNYRKSAFFGPG
jgi:predicted PurR-regulated permease PerM